MPLDFDINAREAEILGKPQRISPVRREDLDPGSTSVIEDVRRTLVGELTKEQSDIFGVMSRHPGLFKCQMDAALQLIKKGEIPRREQELIILRVAWLNQAPYEWGEHVRLALAQGVSTEEIKRIRGDSSEAGWSDHDRAIIQGVDELLEHKMLSDEIWDALAVSWNEKQLMEFPYLVGQYFLTALVQNSLRIRLDRFNQGLSQVD